MKKYLLQITASLLCLATLNGCMTMKPNDFKNKKPIFLLEEYFNGSTRNIEDLTVGQSLEVSVIGCRIKYGSDKIQIVAKPN